MSITPVSPKLAEEKALFEAKKNAIMKAGGQMEVRSLSFFSIMNGQDNYADEETFAQLNSVFVNGLVRVLEIKNERKAIPGTSSQIAVVKIEAEVTIEQKTDPEFVIEIKGIKNFYKEGEKFEFTMKPYKNCYLRAFWFDNTFDGKGEIFYPDDSRNADIEFEEKKIYTFPLKKGLDSKAIAGDIIMYRTTNEPMEKNIILIVATKKKIPFIGEYSYNNFFSWYYKIAPEDRSEIQGFLVNITE